MVVISPNQVKNLRGRYGSAGNKDDRFDAYVLADTLRTDRARLRPLVPDTEATIALRAPAEPARTWSSTASPLANQLRAHLRNVFPGAIGLFADIDSEISLAFLSRFDTQDRADWLTPKRLGDWLSKQGYSGRTDPAVLHQRLLAAPRGATGTTPPTRPTSPPRYVALLRTLVEQIRALSTQIDHQLDAHADAHIFTTLPRSGRVRAARLLGEIGDCRARFPTPESLTCLAGAAPSTRQSGKTPRRRVPLVLRQTAARRRHRLRRRQPTRQPLGRRAIASLSTLMWSAAVLYPALSVRSCPAKNSLVLSHHTPSGWNPEVRSNVGEALCFSDCAITIVASTPRTTVAPRSGSATLLAGISLGS